MDRFVLKEPPVLLFPRGRAAVLRTPAGAAISEVSSGVDRREGAR
ncbi:MAG: hypothetical protein AAGU11_05695 [Syntrophobacteraceae bacterium]